MTSGCATRPPAVEVLSACSATQAQERLRWVGEDDTIVVTLAGGRYVQLKVRDASPLSLCGTGWELQGVGGEVKRSEPRRMEIARNEIVAVCYVPYETKTASLLRAALPLTFGLLTAGALLLVAAAVSLHGAFD
jgi:hypothetical protein